MSELYRPQWVLSLLLAAACGSASDDGKAASAGASGTAQQGGAGASGRAGRPSGGAGASADKGGSTSSGDERELTIRFRGKLSDGPLSCTETYAGVGSAHTQVEPVDFRFYVQDLRLIDKDGNEVPVRMKDKAPWQTADVALIDLTDVSGSCVGTPETNDVILGSVPRGAYKGIAFRNGVPEALNHEDPLKYPPPLQVTDLAWSWLTGFRFLVAEVHQNAASVDADAGGLPGVGLLHIGSTACKANMGCAHANRNAIVLPEFEPDGDVIAADLGALFADTDLTSDAQCHSASESCAPMFARAGVSFQTGESLPQQSLFSVERAK